MKNPKSFRQFVRAYRREQNRKRMERLWKNLKRTTTCSDFIQL
jgi:hypothetical protein